MNTSDHGLTQPFEVPWALRMGWSQMHWWSVPWFEIGTEHRVPTDKNLKGWGLANAVAVINFFLALVWGTHTWIMFRYFRYTLYNWLYIYGNIYRYLVRLFTMVEIERGTLHFYTKHWTTNAACLYSSFNCLPKCSSWTAWPLKMGPMGCPEQSVTNYQSTLRKISEEQRLWIGLLEFRRRN